MTNKRLPPTAQLAEILAFGPNVLYTAETSGSYAATFISENVKTQLGYEADEFLRDPGFWAKHIHPEDAPRIFENLSALFETGRQVHEYRFLHKDGRYRWMYDELALVLDANGNPEKLIGSWSDITARKEIEDQLRKSEERLREAERVALIGHWEIDAERRDVLRSDQSVRNLGLRPGEMRPDFGSFLERVHPDDRQMVAAKVEAAWKSLEPGEYEFRTVWPNGEIRTIRPKYRFEVDETGAPKKMFGVNQDITARKEIDDRLRRSEERLIEAERIALLGYWEFDVKRGESLRSDQSLRNLGLEPGEKVLDLEGFLECIHPDDREMVKANVESMLKNMTPDGYEFRALWPNGEVRTLRSKFRFEVDETGALAKLFGITQDITERKQAEAEARSKEEQLRQYRKMEMVGKLAGGIAHDFNNLLAVINGTLEFLAESATQGVPSDQELIDAALRSGRRGAELVRRLLTFSRQAPLKSEPTAIDQLILDMTRLLQRTLGERIDVEVDLGAGTAMALIDRDQFGSALLDLVLNARDAMPKGGQLTIGTTIATALREETEDAAKCPPGKEICLKITDTGCGMTGDVRERAVEPFFTTKPSELGSGLGLTMVYGFVKQSDGQIAIDSVPGHGTTITISLPMIAAAEHAHEAPRTGPTPAIGDGKIVMLVEDDTDVRLVTAAQLKKLGYIVYAPANGTEAMDVISAPVPIDIVLTDMVLPGGVDGITVLKEALRARPRVGLLGMSGYTPTRSSQEWLKAQNIQLLSKPFSIAKLADALEKLIVR